MSVASWKAQYYRVDAGVPATKEERLLHCIRKWEGLYPEVLKAYGLKWQAMEAAGWLGVSTCALCSEYLCDECPLPEALGETASNCNSPLRDYRKYANPGPMLEGLRKALRQSQAEPTPESRAWVVQCTLEVVVPAGASGKSAEWVAEQVALTAPCDSWRNRLNEPSRDVQLDLLTSSHDIVVEATPKGGKS